MARITYIAADGAARTIDVDDGVSLMEAAVANGVPGIDGDCGGNCACATCHVHVAPEWLAAAGARSEMEAAMLEFADGVTADSRLACQIAASPALDGMVVRTPASQH
ncbi:MAG: 2Fe-2S iron-sulfur cluster binding domain-containing protein [Sphingomonadaceae bacterium]|nr:2Fe-2S iron-sulfur cluster binding domain-containing protein [Sphingomonadaceae bacterium]